MNFSSGRELISQEIWARLILYNFCSIITACAVIEQKNTKYSYQVNFSKVNRCQYCSDISKTIIPTSSKSRNKYGARLAPATYAD